MNTTGVVYPPFDLQKYLGLPEQVVSQIQIVRRDGDIVELTFPSELKEVLSDVQLGSILREYSRSGIASVNYFNFSNCSKLSPESINILLKYCPLMREKVFHDSFAVEYLTLFENTFLSEESERNIYHILHYELSCLCGKQLEERLCSVNSQFYKAFAVGKFPILKKELEKWGKWILSKQIQELDEEIKKEYRESGQNRTGIILNKFSLFAGKLAEKKFPCYGIFDLISKASFSSWDFQDEEDGMRCLQIFLEQVRSLDPTNEDIAFRLAVCDKANIRQNNDTQRAKQALSNLISRQENQLDAAVMTSFLSELLPIEGDKGPTGHFGAKIILEDRIRKYSHESGPCRLSLAQLVIAENGTQAPVKAYRLLAPLLFSSNSCISRRYFQFFMLKRVVFKQPLPEISLEHKKLLQYLTKRDRNLKIVMNKLLFVIYRTSWVACIENFEQFKKALGDERKLGSILLAMRATPFYRIALDVMETLHTVDIQKQSEELINYV